MPGPRPIIRPGLLTPTPMRQSAVVGALYLGGPVLGTIRNPRNVVRGWKLGAGAIQSATELKGLLPALGTSHKVGVRFGSQDMTTIGSTALGQMYLGGMPEADLPVPTFGFGLTSVPTGSSRLVFEMNKTGIDGKSRGDQLSPSMQTREVKTRKSMRGPSATITKGSKKPRMVRRRGSRCPPGYRYDAKRRMCIQTFKR